MARISVEEAQDQIEDFLRENGSANISELVRELGCARGTVYNAIENMEEHDMVSTSYSGNKRVVTLRNAFPGYLKVFLFALSITVALRYMEGVIVHELVKVNLLGSGSEVSEGATGVSIIYPSVITILLIFLLGFGAAIIVLKYEDVQEIYGLLRDKIAHFFDWIQ